MSGEEGLTFTERAALMRAKAAHPSVRSVIVAEIGPMPALDDDTPAEVVAQVYWRTMQALNARAEELEAIDRIEAYTPPPAPPIKPEWAPPQTTSWED